MNTRENKISGRLSIKHSKSDRLFYAFCYSIVFFLTLVVVYPLIYIVSASFSSAASVISGKMWLWPIDISLEGYKYILQYRYVWIGYRNTLLYTFSGTALGICMTLMCAYPLARNTLRGRKFFTLLFAFTMIFNGGMIPTYVLMMKLNFIDKIWVMIIPGCMSVYNMIVTRTFLQSSIPNEILEAAKMDGFSDFRFFISIVLPLSKAIIAVLALMYAAVHWNSYFSAFLYLKTKSLYPLQIFLRQILVQSNFDTEMLDPEMVSQLQTLQQTLKYSLIVVATAPILCFYPFVQKYFQKGIMIGSLKG